MEADSAPCAAGVMTSFWRVASWDVGSSWGVASSCGTSASSGAGDAGMSPSALGGAAAAAVQIRIHIKQKKNYMQCM